MKKTVSGVAILDRHGNIDEIAAYNCAYFNEFAEFNGWPGQNRSYVEVTITYDPKAKKKRWKKSEFDEEGRWIERGEEN